MNDTGIPVTLVVALILVVALMLVVGLSQSANVGVFR